MPVEIVAFVSKMMPVRIADLAKPDLMRMISQLEQKEQCEVADGGLDGDRDGRQEITNDRFEITMRLDALEDRFRKLEELKSGEGEVMMALGRVFSGDLSTERDLFVLGGRYDPMGGKCNEVDKPTSITRVPAGSFSLYLCFGPSIFQVSRVPAGNIVGIVGLDWCISKTATISSSTLCYPMRAITFQAIPMVRVAVEPISHSDLKKVEIGLRSLYQYDPAVEVDCDDSGQMTINCLGELHLEQCIKMLTEKLCKCQVKASEPIVQFRETILPVDKSFQRAYTLPPPWGVADGLGGRKKKCNDDFHFIFIFFRCGCRWN
jgi:translation elongation factor EF-G